MKRINITKGYVFIILAVFSIACHQDEVTEMEIQKSITEEITKIETIYNVGDVKIENETFEEKIESSANETLKKKIWSELGKSYSKTTTYSKTNEINIPGYHGVFKETSCGQYNELAIFMDCEDNRPWTKKYGEYIGASEVDSKKNVKLKFCLIPNFPQRSTRYDYGILFLGDNYLNLDGASTIIRTFDNEDSSNTNYYEYNGVKQNNEYKVLGGVNGDYPLTYIGGRNTRLTFKYFKGSSSSGDFPYIGIPYGVLGQFGDATDKGSIYIDDEDRGNANGCEYKEHIGGNVYKSFVSVRSGSISTLMDVGGNTELFISKAY